VGPKITANNRVNTKPKTHPAKTQYAIKVRVSEGSINIYLSYI
jgi:hypothetical protein